MRVPVVARKAALGAGAMHVAQVLREVAPTVVMLAAHVAPVLPGATVSGQMGDQFAGKLERLAAPFAHMVAVRRVRRVRSRWRMCGAPMSRPLPRVAERLRAVGTREPIGRLVDAHMNANAVDVRIEAFADVALERAIVFGLVHLQVAQASRREGARLERASERPSAVHGNRVFVELLLGAERGRTLGDGTGVGRLHRLRRQRNRCNRYLGLVGVAVVGIVVVVGIAVVGIAVVGVAVVGVVVVATRSVATRSGLDAFIRSGQLVHDMALPFMMAVHVLDQHADIAKHVRL